MLIHDIRLKLIVLIQDKSYKEYPQVLRHLKRTLRILLRHILQTTEKPKQNQMTESDQNLLIEHLNNLQQVQTHLKLLR